jgi:chaperone modulatory protein CbpM
MSTAYTTTIVESEPLSLHDLARAVGAEERWIVQLVEVEILHVDTPNEAPERWHFHSADLQRALAARRLERDFGANLDTAALILDLQQELRHLHALLAAHGIR